MFEEYLRSPATPVLTFLIGLAVGHWLAIHRDKRKEYNELVTPLRKEILAETERPSPARVAISRHDADAIAARMNRFRHFQFMKACERYWEAKKDQYQDDLGQPLHPNEQAIRQAAKKLIEQIPIR